MSEVDPAALKELGEGLARLQRFADAEKVAAELATAGVQGIEQDSHAIDFVFADEQALWDWNWSHGTRAVMEAVPEEPRKRYRAEVAEAMEQVRESNGFPRTFTSVFTRGISG
jgi:hypothetical protein